MDHGVSTRQVPAINANALQTEPNRQATESSHENYAPDAFLCNTSVEDQPQDRPVPAEAADKMSPAVVALARHGSDELVDVLVAYEDMLSDAELAAMNGRMMRNFANLEIAQVQIPAASIGRLGLDDGIAHLSLDEPVMGASAKARKTAIPAQSSTLPHFPSSGICSA